MKRNFNLATPIHGLGMLHMFLTVLAGNALAVQEFGAQEDGNSGPLRQFELKRPAMGVELTIVAWCRDPDVARDAFHAAAARVDEMEEALSNYRPDSEVSQLADRAKDAPIRPGDDLWLALSRSQDVWRASNGIFDPTIGPVSELWREARRTGQVPDAEQLAAARKRVGWEKLSLDEDSRTLDTRGVAIGLDFGGIGKGMAADEALRILRDKGILAAMVELGGDMAIGDAPPGRDGWRIAIDSFDADAVPNSCMEVARCGVATSGDKHQFIEIAGVRYGHLINPASGRPVRHSSLMTAIAGNAADADGWASVFCLVEPSDVLPLAKANSSVEVRGEVLTTSGAREVFQSPGFPVIRDVEFPCP